MIAIDTNILIYSHRQAAPEYARATQLLRELVEGDDTWAIPWPCIYEFFSVVTNPRIWKATASTPQQAWSQIAEWMASPTLRLLAEPDGFASDLANVATRARVRGAVIHDARVAAICISHGVDRLITRDRDFSLFPELVTENPFA